MLGAICNDSVPPYDRAACSGQNAICNSSYLYGAGLDGADYDGVLCSPKHIWLSKSEVKHSICLFQEVYIEVLLIWMAHVLRI